MGRRSSALTSLSEMATAMRLEDLLAESPRTGRVPEGREQHVRHNICIYIYTYMVQR